MIAFSENGARLDPQRVAFVPHPDGHSTVEPMDLETPVDRLEPDTTSASGDRAEILAAILQWCFKAKQKRTAFNRFVVLCYVLKPEIFNGASQAGAAKQLGLTRSAISKIVVLIQDELKIFSRSSRSPEARERYRERALAVHRRRKRKTPLARVASGIESPTTATNDPTMGTMSTNGGPS